MKTPNDRVKEAILTVCIPCFLDKVKTRYPRGRAECPRCGKSNDKAHKKAITGSNGSRR